MRFRHMNSSSSARASRALRETLSLAQSSQSSRRNQSTRVTINFVIENHRITAVDGILIIDKPEGLTSHDVVSRVRRIFGTRRVGHTGTLDPFATGVLVLLLGKATRLARFLDKDVKEYVAEVQFGWETDTGDLTGLRNAECGLRNEELTERLINTDWNSVLAPFRGEILQTPPMYSAKKVEGKKLYELARAGVEVAREPERVTIYELAIVDHSELETNARMILRVACSAGTYVRTLAQDIGRAVGVGAHLNSLRRTAAGQFDLRRSFTLEQVKDSPVPENTLLPLDFAVNHLPEFRLTDDRVAPTRDGLTTRASDSRYEAGQYVRMTEPGEGAVIAVGVFDDDEKVIRPKVVLI